MPKVLHLIDHPGLGGAQRLVNTILQNRPEDRVLALRAKPPHLIHLLADRCLLPVKPLGLRNLSALYKLPSLLRKYQIQIIHCHLSVSWLLGYLLSRSSLRKSNIRFLFHAHSSEKIHRPFYRLLTRLACRAGKIIVVSRFIQQQHLKLGIPENRLLLLRNFVELEQMQTNDPQKLPLDLDWVGENKLVGFAGRLTYNKGLSYLVEAMHHLRNTSIKLLIAGIGPYQNKLTSQIEKYGLEDRVYQLGFLEHLPDFFHSIDVFASPSLMEAFGLVHLEAQAAGCVVVAFDIDAIRETIGAENALLAQKGNAKDLADCIFNAATDKALHQRLTQRGLQNARRFSKTQHLEVLADIYRSLLEPDKP